MKKNFLIINIVTFIVVSLVLINSIFNFFSTEKTLIKLTTEYAETINKHSAIIENEYKKNVYAKQEILQKSFNRIKAGMSFDEVKRILNLDAVYKAKNDLLVLPPHKLYDKIYEEDLHPRSLKFSEDKVIAIEEKNVSKKTYDKEIPDKIELILPEDKQLKTFYLPEVKMCPIYFRWKFPKGAYPMEFEVEITNSTLSETKTISKIVKSNFYDLGEMNFPKKLYGNFTWKIRAINKFGKGEWSKIRRFSINDSSESYK